MSERLNDLTQRLHQVGERLRKAQPQSAGVISDEILHQLDQVIDQLREHSGAGYQEGHDWVVQIFTHLPQLNPVIDRDILWYFGGDCLHFLTDDEIALFQQLDEKEAEAESNGEDFDRTAEKARLSAAD
ncbi:MAG: hypothetical protein CMI08_01995 [Oceanospirillaceae bacterium]|uniref:PA2817 family protein n=1 Tax=unclassified Thalassolituus TaxID=2624967 RepID=UPI000C08DD1A|nr:MULTISPECIES: PA2817 family protein [unclassified Thalassolituus]MAK90898.1 hypothetical protein [Thalassolituus sp.]MAS25103.1 hypothetical protein [Oceanospirillaceae bacterium]MAX97969.1 hypothetical protein [Oceanospirillaceae bacterium]MBL34136.1 hypothetical protein [Oceanospirillaceae bacterium]MBS52131.1 hypothetical protein [Oceanospirillaceae bacterium]|tara:strand:- start:1134 stop:1520 length:387 start_codon:yes stop_codon:yes gene_type:complete